ncbi:MAG: T9SS type A sorting domain-containing protein, partial [Flavobacteriales bacterium]|nr:T9SS type A sorting domain-containing protein [Flavobacteriales bacterium]
LRDQNTQIDLRNLSSATYLLKISDNTKNLKTFKIIRNN